MNGIVYIAMREPKYLEMAMKSARSLRAQGCRDFVRLVTDLKVDDGRAPLFDEVVFTDDGKWRGRGVKTRLPTFARDLDRCLFLDCDTEMVRPIDEIWATEGHLSLAVHPDDRFLKRVNRLTHFFRLYGREMRETLGMVNPMSTPYYNSGVILFDAVGASVLEGWHEEWSKYGKIDQLALVRLLAKTKAGVTELPLKFNSPTLLEDTVVHHYYWMAK